VPVFYDEDKDAREMSVALFRKLDSDDNGKLTQEELLHARTLMLCHSDHGQRAIRGFTGMSAEVDKNHDNEIDMDEWHDFIGSLYELMGRRQFMVVVKSWATSAGMKGHGQAGNGGVTGRRRSRGQAAAGPAAVRPDQSPEAPAPRRGAISTPPEPPRGQDQASEVELDLSDPALVAAAARIQAVQRGKKVRKQVNLEKPKRHKSKILTEVINLTDQRLTSVVELWEEISMADGAVKTSVEATELVHWFAGAKATGLDLMLAAHIPMHFTDTVEPEDVSPGEVAHLCLMLIENQELTVADARAALEPIKHNCREEAATGMAVYSVDPEATINFKRFRHLLLLLSTLMRIDEQYIVSHLQWQSTGRFEMTDIMASLVLQECVRRGGYLGSEGPLPQVTADALWESLAAGTDLEPADKGMPNLELMRGKITLDDFVRLCYNSGIIDANGKAGITYMDMSALYGRVHGKLPELLRVHAEKASKLNFTPTMPPKDRDKSLQGRTEFEILLEELHREPSMLKMYRSPLQMTLGLIQRTKGPLP